MNLTTLTLPISLHPAHIPNFRAAIVEHLGLGHELFHGHDNREAGVTKYSNAYPLIRFAVHKGRAQVIGMGEGARAIVRHLVPLLPDTLTIAGESHDIRSYRLKSSIWEPEVLPEYCAFGLYQWIALNKENYTDWKKHEGHDGARRLLLDRCLTGHLRALAEAAGIEKAERMRIVARVLRQDKVKSIEWHGNKFVAFNIVAEANFQPPYGFGLGRCHSFGFGEVCSERHYRSLTKVKRGSQLSGDSQAAEEVMV